MYARNTLIAAALAVVAAAPAAAAMTTGTFVTRARALQAEGTISAMLDPDFQTLRGEAKAATAQLKADRAAREAAGKQPIACVPEGQSLGILDMLDGLDALSPAEKKLPLKDGYAHVLAKRFPC